MIDFNFNKNVYLAIENMVNELNIGYMEAVLKYCSDNDLDESFIGDIINKNQKIKAEIEIEAEKLNFLKKTDRVCME